MDSMWAIGRSGENRIQWAESCPPRKHKLCVVIDVVVALHPAEPQSANNFKSFQTASKSAQIQTQLESEEKANEFKKLLNLTKPGTSFDSNL